MSKSVVIAVALAGLLLGSAPLQAALSWSSQLPAGGEGKQERKAAGGHVHGGHRGGTPFYLHDSAGAEAEVWLPTLMRRSLEVDGRGVVRLSGTGLDNYHLLYARRQGEGLDELALRYQPMRGKPSGESPRLLVGYRKGALDIVPSPLTREHQRYQSGRPAVYTVMFKNRPLPSQPLQLTTSNGTTLELLSDGQGMVSVLLPDDFKGVGPGRSANRPAEFVLSTSYENGGIDYRTTISADYHVNPSHWQSTGGGLLAMLAGFVGGLVVIRRSRKGQGETKNV